MSHVFISYALQVLSNSHPEKSSGHDDRVHAHLGGQ